MIITKKVMRNVSLTAHPEGCKRYVQQQIDWVKNQAQNGRTRAIPILPRNYFQSECSSLEDPQDMVFPAGS